MRFGVSPTDIPTRILILLSLLALGVAIPLVVLHVLNWWFARFSAPHMLAALDREVRIVPKESVAPAGGEPLEAGFDAFAPLNQDSPRNLEVGPFALRTIASYSREDGLFTLHTGPTAVATSGDGGCCPAVTGSSAPCAKDARERSLSAFRAPGCSRRPRPSAGMTTTRMA